MYFVYHNRAGEGTVSLAIVVYIDWSFIKHKIPVKQIYVTVRNLNSVMSDKACAWRVLGMMQRIRKSATLAQTDTWRKDRRLRLHHADLNRNLNDPCESEIRFPSLVAMLSRREMRWLP